MTRKIEGTNKFVIYFYNGKNVRGKHKIKSKNFVYKQSGGIHQMDENNKPIGKGYPFQDYGKMISIINKLMRKKVMNNLKEKRAWK